MSEPSPFGDKKEGLLQRLFGRAARVDSKSVVRRSEVLDLVVPAERADAVRTALESWLAGHGITAAITSEDAGEGKTRLRTSLGNEDSGKLDLSSEAIQKELERILSDAVTKPPG